MELCPKCGKLSAERNHYTLLLLCYNTECDYEEKLVVIEGPNEVGVVDIDYAFGAKRGHCSKCGQFLTQPDHIYCFTCGSKIDWYCGVM